MFARVFFTGDFPLISVRIARNVVSAVVELQRLRPIAIRRRRILFGSEGAEAKQRRRDSLLVLGRRLGIVRCGGAGEEAAADAGAGEL